MILKNNKSEDKNGRNPGHRIGFQRGVMFTGSAATVTIFALFLETMAAVRFLETHGYGTYVLILAVVSFLAMLIDLGLKTAVIQLIASSDPERQQRVVNTVIFFRILVVIGVSLLFLAGKEILLFFNFSPEIIRFAIFIPLMLLVISLDELFAGMLQGFHVYNHMATAQIIRSFLRLTLTIFFLAVLKFGIFSLIYSWIISYSVTAIYQYFHLPVERAIVLDRKLLGEILRFAFPLQMSRFLWFVSGRLDILLLGSLAGVNSVALYDVATKIPNALNRLFDSFINVFFPNMSTLLAKEKRNRANLLLEQSLRLVSFALAVAAFAVVLFGGEIITLVFSGKYADSAFAFALIMISLQIGGTLMLMGYTLTSAGFPGRSLTENIFRTIITVGANLLLIPALGFLGSAWSRVIANYTSNPLAVWLLRRSKIAVAVSSYARATAVLLMFSLIYWLFEPQLLVVKGSFFLGFVIANFAVSSVTLPDLGLLIPRFQLKKVTITPEE